MSALDVRHDGDIAVVTIDRPSRRNALDEALWSGLHETFTHLGAADVRAVVVAGAGGHFCSGMDLKSDNPITGRIAAAVDRNDVDDVAALITQLKGVFAALRALPCVTIAAIEGACAGGGLELALACDLRVAATNARLSLPETRHGMIPDVGGTVRLAQLVGVSRATDLVLTSRALDAVTAERWGLVDRVCPPGRALHTAHELAASAMLAGPTATAAALAVLRSLEDPHALARETRAGAEAICSGEVREGLAAFAEKRSTLF